MKLKRMLSKMTTIMMVGVMLVGCTSTGGGNKESSSSKEVTVETAEDGTTREMEGNLYGEKGYCPGQIF